MNGPWDRWIRWSMANESSYVTDPSRARRMIARQGLLALVGIGALVADDLAGGLLGSVSGALIGWFVGMSLFGGVRRAVAYKAGWLAGRSAMIAAFSEAGHRKMSLEDWLAGEMVRDYAVMGLRPPTLEELKELRRDREE